MSESEPQTEVDRLPQAIERKLRGLVRRARLVIAVRGVCVVLTVLAICTLLVMAVDASTTFLSAWPRWVLTAGVAAATVLAAARFLVRPLARSFSLAGIALALEKRHPELQERISSAVELLRSRDAPELRGSGALIAALVDEARHDVEWISPAREFTLRRVRSLLLALLAAAALLGGLLVAWPREAGRLLARAVAPFLNLPNVAAYQLSVEPGDVKIQPGDALQIQVTVDNARVDAANLHIRDSEGRTRVRRMEREADPEPGVRVFSAVAPPTHESFQYRIHAGDALSRYYSVGVYPPPLVERLDIRYDYPDYGHLEPRLEEDSEGDISAVVGTRVTVTAHLSKPVVEGSALLGADGAPLARGKCEPTEEGKGTCRISFEMTPEMVGSWRLEVRDEHGFTNPQQRFAIEALPDAAPRAWITSPARRRLRCRPGERVPILYALRDDLGLARAELVRTKDGSPVEPVPLADGQGVLSASAGVTLDLGDPALEGAREVQFRLRAADGLPAARGGPQEGTSRTFTVRLEPGAPPYAEQVWDTMESEVREGMQQTLEELKAAEASSAELEENLSEEEEPTRREREALGETMDHLAEAELGARELAQRTRESPFRPLAPGLEELAEQQVSPAQDAAAQAELARSAEERGEFARQTTERIRSAIESAGELLKEFDAMAEALGQQRQLQHLAGQQAELARRSRQLDEASAPQWEQEQRSVAEALAGLMEQMPAARLAEAARARRRMAEMAEEARRLQQEQRALRERTRELNGLQGGREGEKAPSLEEWKGLRQDMLGELAEEQQRIAEGARQLAETVAERKPQEDRLERRAAQAAAEARQKIESAEVARAAQRADQAARNLSELGSRLEAEEQASRHAAETPAGAEEQTNTVAGARELARRQQTVAEGLHRLAEGDPAGALSAQQGALQEETAGLRADAEEAHRHTSLSLGEPTAEPAGRAAASLSAAETAEGEATGSLAAAQAEQALPRQEVAEAALGEAARALEEATGALAATVEQSPAEPPGETAAAEGEALAEALQAAGAAAETRAPADARQAALSLDRAAEQASALARSLGLQPFSLAQLIRARARYRRGEGDGRTGAGPIAVGRAMERLRGSGIALEEWATLPSELRNDILQAGEQRRPEEYRGLIKRYFRQVARLQQPGETGEETE